MDSQKRIVYSIKQVLRAQQMTYADFAAALGVTETTVKRMLTQRISISLQRLDEICSVLGTKLETLLRIKPPETEVVPQFTEEQELALVADEKMNIIYGALLANLTPKEVHENYKVSMTEVKNALVKLDKLELLKLYSDDRVQFKRRYYPDPLPGGPLTQAYEKENEIDFLDHDFSGPNEFRDFQSFPLSERSQKILAEKLRRLTKEARELSELDQTLGLANHEFASFYFGLRQQWVPIMYRRYWRRRKKE